MFALCLSHAEEFDLAAELQKAKASNAKTLTIPPGTHRLPETGLRLKGINDLLILGDSATLVARAFNKSAIELIDCRNVTLRGFTLDYDPLPFTQGTITKVDPKAGTVDFSVHAGYPELKPEYLVSRLHLFEGNKHRWKVGAPDYYPPRVEALDPKTGRAFFDKNMPGFEKFELGDRVALNIRNAPAVAIRIGCEDILLDGVTIHASAGLGIITRFAKDGGHLRNVRIVPGRPPAGATEPRLLSTCADAVNIAYTREGPIIENCEFA